MIDQLPGLRTRLAARLRTRTLQGRVSVLAIAVIAGWLVVLAVGFVLVLTSRIDRQVNEELEIRAQAASTTVEVSGGRIVRVRESGTDSELDASTWVYSGGRALLRPSLGADLQRAADRLVDAGRGYRDLEDHRFYVLPVIGAGHRVGTVVVAINRQPFDRTRDTVILATAAVMVLLLLGAYLVLRFATGRALRPVARMTDQAAEWSINAPAQRFGRQHYVELDSLAATLDELLDRLAAVLRHERHLSAELSHELRTPLTRVAAQVDLLMADARPDQLDELQMLHDNCAAMDTIMDTLLAAARSELTRTVGRCDVSTALRGFAEASGRPAVHVTAPARLAVGVEQELFTRMLAPVLDNARRHAAHEINIAAERSPEGVVVAVSNDGPLLDPADARRVFDPGFRGADTDPNAPGAGLGLALARRLARAADGDLTVDLAASRTTFRLVLPAG